MEDRAATYGLVWAQGMPSVARGAVLASLGWFTAFTLRKASDMRAPATVEVLHGHIVWRRLFAESITRREAAGIGLLEMAIGAISAQR